MPDLGVIAAWFHLVYEFADFAYSAIVHYANTPEGAADWNDILTALGGVGLVDMPTEAETPPGSTAQEVVMNGWQGIGQVRNAPNDAGKAPHERLAAAPRKVNRPVTPGQEVSSG